MMYFLKNSTVQRVALTLVSLIVGAYAVAQGHFGLKELAIALAPTLMGWAHLPRPGDVSEKDAVAAVEKAMVNSL
jgi:hypothetical protein